MPSGSASSPVERDPTKDRPGALGLVHAYGSREKAALTNPLIYFRDSFPRSLNARLTTPKSAEGLALAYRFRQSAECVTISDGVLDHPHFEEDFAFWRQTPAPIILWGGGVHGSHPFEVVERPGYEAYHQLRGFTLIGLRDDVSGFTWVPCPSCMHPLLDHQAGGRSGSGILVILDPRSHEMPEFVATVTAQAPDADVIFSDEPFERQIGAIRRAGSVATNDYHAAYWATLLNRRVVAFGGGGRMRMFRYPVTIGRANDWRRCLDQAIHHPKALEECRQANLDFRDRVQQLLGKISTRKPFMRDPRSEHLADHPVKPTSPLPGHHVVPRILHFVFGLGPDFGGKPFNLMHKIAVLSAMDRIRPEQIFLHYRYLPYGPDFDAVKHMLTLVKLPPPADPSMHFAHQADVVRLQALYEQGGIYLDLDTITVSSFDRLLRHPFSIGLQGRAPVDGLCNAVLLAAPRNQFIGDWLGAYARFTSEWDKFSVRLPYAMWRSGKWHAHVEPYDSFHWPLWTRAGLEAMFEHNVSFPNALCHHLWESFAYRRYFEGRSSEDVVRKIGAGESTYDRLARPYL